MKNWRMNLSRSGIWSTVGGNGISEGRSGGGRRLRHPQLALGWFGTEDVDADETVTALGNSGGKM